MTILSREDAIMDLDSVGIDIMSSAYISPSRPNLCPECGRSITLQRSGWWTHDGLAGECWRFSMDGPSEQDVEREYADQRAHNVAWMTADEREQLDSTPSVAVLAVQRAESELRAALADMSLNEGQGTLAEMDARTDAVADARRSLAAAKDHCQF